MSNSKNDRISRLDALKGIGIFLVVFGHIIHIPGFRTYIWGFHMPIFFFISGIMFKYEKYLSFKCFLLKKIVSLIFPYLFFYISTLTYWILIERNFRGEGVPIWTQFIGMIYGTYSMRYMMFNGALWFIPCLFSMGIIYYFFSYLMKANGVAAKLGGLLIIYMIGISLLHYMPALPQGICAACLGIGFYGVGNIFRKPLIEIDLSYKSLFPMVICGILLQILLYPYSGADLASLKIPNIYMYMPVGFVGIAVYFCIADVLRESKILRYMGMNSLVIFTLQEPCYRMVLFLFSKMADIPVESIRLNVVYCLFATFVTILFICPAIFLWNKWGKSLQNMMLVKISSYAESFN